MTSGLSATNSSVCLRISAPSAVAQRGVDLHIAADGPAQERQLLQERSYTGLIHLIIRGGRYEHTNAPHSFALLSAGGKRPSRCRAAKQPYELASLQSIELHLMSQPTLRQHIALVRIKSSPRCGAGFRPG
jgi:hypothetical protein